MNYKEGRWQRLREQALARDHYECQWCAVKGKAVKATTVHHIMPADKYPDKAYELNNLVSLCRSCHEAHHGRAAGQGKAADRFPEWW
ncbi:MAG: HNH endonuclease signature motif containing protein [Peptococcaceae bacterium]|nr:HNH endonuclease signature motif containing protein [Peptococcaceae bacterium]